MTETSLTLLAYRALVIAVFGPIYLTALLVFVPLEGRDGFEESTEQFREIIP